MCIICVQYQKNKDLIDARRMLEAAKREARFIVGPKYIEEKHLEEIEAVLDYKEKLFKGITK